MGFFDRLATNIGNAPAESWFSLAKALGSTPTVGQGLATGLADFGQTALEARKKQGMAQMLQGMVSKLPEDQQPLASWLATNSPEEFAKSAATNMFSKPAETWKSVDVNGDGRPDFQQSSITGEFKDMPKTLADEERLRRAQASTVTVNNIPPEMGARIGMGEGFLKNFDNIKATAKNFYGSNSIADQAKRRGQIMFNTGDGGALWRDVESGKEALVRQLTGSGMAQSEADAQAKRYSISPFDTQFDALTKLDNLKRDLENVASGAYRAKGGHYTAPAPVGAPGEMHYDAQGNLVR